ncbi:Uncharacterised protein [Bordetella pertussis]|nr:Uncharacterised protein [Bordetella pertussis]
MTYVMPTLPPAPGRFSTSTVCFRCGCIAWAMARPKMSAAPPGGYGTTTVTGCSG